MDYGNGINANGVRGFIADTNPLQDLFLNTRNYESHSAWPHAYAERYIQFG